MHLLFSAELLVFALLYVPAFARFDLARRLVCVQDDLYEGFHNADPENINPWCSSYLGIPEYTATRIGGTSRTTVITTTTTFTPYLTTTTVPDYITTTTTTLDALKRRDAIPDPTPAPSLNQLYSDVPLLQECDTSEANKSVISSVASACSCLFILPRTVDIHVTTTFTRTETAIDYQSTPIYVTQPSNATLTETIYPSGAPYNSTTPGSSGTFLTTSVPISSSCVSGSPRPSKKSFSHSSDLSLVSSTISTSTDVISVTTSSQSTPSCVVQDGLIITQRDGESFQAYCFTSFMGPSGVGLDEPTYRACLQQCSLNNDGFSDIGCYGVSYFPDRLGPNCYLKTKAGVATADYNPNYRVVSGKLLLNATNDTSSTVSSSSTPMLDFSPTSNVEPIGPTAGSSMDGDYNYNYTWGPGPWQTDGRTRSTSPRPTAPGTTIINATTASLTPSASLNSTLAPSITPTPSFNVSFSPSSSPTESYNNTPPVRTDTEIPRSGRPSPSGNGTSSGFPIPSANVTSGLPLPSANVTSGLPIPSVNVTTSGFPIPTSNGTSSGFPTPSSNQTSGGPPLPTSNGTSSGFPSPSANVTSGLPIPSVNATSSGFPIPSSNATSGFPVLTSNGTSSGFPTPSGNSSTCLFTTWMTMTATTTESVCQSQVTVYTTAPPRSTGSTKTITQTLTIAV